MTTTEARPRVTRETLQDRWSVLTTGIFNDATETTSGLYDRLSGALRTLAGRIVGGVQGDTEYQGLCDLEYRLERYIESEIIAWATRIELDRAVAKDREAA